MESDEEHVARNWCRVFGWKVAAKMMSHYHTNGPAWFLATCGDMLPRKPVKTGAGAIQYGVGGSYIV